MSFGTTACAKRNAIGLPAAEDVDERALRSEAQRDGRPDGRKLCDRLRMRERVLDERPRAWHRIRGGDAHIEAGSLEQAAHRDDQTLREQQHVEEQRAHRRDAEHAKRRARRLAHEAPPGESHGVHRRASLSPLRRSSAHDATTVAVTPSGTAMATQRAATSGVTRTKISAVS